MKIKKLRLHSPKGSTVASVRYIDRHANDYDNTNVWVKPSDIWDPNKTVSELLAMPDVNNGYRMLPGMYKLGFPFKNKKNYDEVKGGILDIEDISKRVRSLYTISIWDKTSKINGVDPSYILSQTSFTNPNWNGITYLISKDDKVEVIQYDDFREQGWQPITSEELAFELAEMQLIYH